jgi:ferredoxin--NADP+ reductase
LLPGSANRFDPRTVSHLLAETHATAVAREPQAVNAYFADRHVDVVEFAGWEDLDSHEIVLGEAQGRARIKVVDR